MRKGVKSVTRADFQNVEYYSRKMSIYTKTGDRGETSLFGGKRVSKDDLRVNAYGNIDELTSFLGMLICKLSSTAEKTFFTNIQKTLYQLMAYLSGAPQDLHGLEKDIRVFENRIDEIELSLPKLTRFILPQGGEIASWCHINRSITRRCERTLVSCASQQSLNNAIAYVNRLSDLLFMYARMYTNDEKSLVT